MHAQINTAKPMREDIPQTEHSKALALQAQLEERAKVTAETGLLFDGDRPYVPAKVLTFAQKDADELFTAPSACVRVDLLRSLEKQRAGKLQTWLATYVLGDDLETLTAKERADAWFGAMTAIRMQVPGAVAEAHRHAVARLEDALRREMGAAFRFLNDEHLHRLAVIAESVAVSAFMGTLDGSRPITPGEILRMHEDGK